MSGEQTVDRVKSASDNCNFSLNNSSNVPPPKPPRNRTKDVFKNIISQEEAEYLAKRATSHEVQVLDYHLRPYTEKKIDFLGSRLLLVIVTKLKGRIENEKLSFFVKTLPYELPSHPITYVVEEKVCFRKESEFFRLLVPLMLEKDFGVHRDESWAPDCYLAKSNTLVFEDMGYKGFVNRSRMFDERTMRSAIDCIARFHACSLVLEARLNGKSLIELFPDLLEETEYQRSGRSLEWYNNAINLCVHVANTLGLDSIRIKKMSECVFEAVKPSMNKRNVVSHGNLWSSNLLFDPHDRCNLVDFQMLRYAPLGHDLMQLLHLCSTREFRKLHENGMIEHYHVSLTKSLRINGYVGVLPSSEDLLGAVEEQRLPALVAAIIFHPTVLMDGKTAAKIVNDLQSYESYYFKNRVPFVEEIMSYDEEYKRRIIEDVEELVEMSLKIKNLG